MKQRLRTTVEILALAIIAAFVGANALGVFVDLFWSGNSKAPESFRGAFLGAFFAFLFVRIGAALSAIFERREKARNALIVTQHRLGEVINALHDNIYVVVRAEEYERSLKSGPPPIFLNSFIPVPGVRDVILLLLNLDLLNELVGLDIEIRKVNDSLQTWERSNQKLTDAFISKLVDHQTYVQNALAGCEELKLIGRYIEALKADAIDSLAAVRILARRDQTLIGKAMLAFGQKHYEPDFERVRAQESSQLSSEAKEINRVGLSDRLTAVQRLRATEQGNRPK